MTLAFRNHFSNQNDLKNPKLIRYLIAYIKQKTG